jgi:hypothetical protein
MLAGEVRSSKRKGNFLRPCRLTKTNGYPEERVSAGCFSGLSERRSGGTQSLAGQANFHVPVLFHLMLQNETFFSDTAVL